MANNSNRGMANADQKTRQRVAHEGGTADHPHGRGLQNADTETRERVSSAGGQSSHGGGRGRNGR